LPVEDSHISHHFKVEQVMSEDDGRAVDGPAFEIFAATNINQASTCGG
jgi:hypothetical protein